MLFKDLKPGHIIYVMDRETLDIKKGNVTNITAPHMEAKMNTPCQLVVDVTAKVGDELVTYITPDGTSVSYFGNLVISPEKRHILSEVNSIMAQCEQLLSSVDATKVKLKKCKSAVSELDDAFREKQYMEDRFASIENSQREMRESQRELTNLVKEFINHKTI